MRRPATLPIAIALFLHLCAGAAFAEMYKWTDKDGTVHITDFPPEGGGKPMNLDSIRINREESPAADGATMERARARRTPSPSPASATAPRDMEYPRVDVYGTSWCPACRRAREYFRSAGIPFNDYDVEKDDNARARMDRLGGGAGVPAIVIGGQVIRGFSAEWCNRALGIR